MADSRLEDQPGPTEANEPAAPQQLVYRRAPKIAPFLVTGGVIGVVIAFFWVAIQGPTQEYEQSQVLGFLAALLAIVGLTIAAIWWMILDRRSKRQMETVLARRTADPSSADVALTKDDYREWSRLQQQEVADEAYRARRAEVKAAAKARKRNKRNS